MKKLLLVLLLIPALCFSQDFKHRYFHYDQYTDDPDHTLNFMTATVDGTDNKQWQICGGGSCAVTRGAFVIVRGNEWGGASGDIDLVAGNTATGSLEVTTGNAIRFTIPYIADLYDSNVLLGPATGNNFQSPIYTLRGQTNDLYDDAILQLTAGGSSTMSGGRGAYIQLEGADVGGTANFGGDINIVSGVGASTTAGQYPVITIRHDTADGFDWGYTLITGGGPFTTSLNRGAAIRLFGNETTSNQGTLELDAGDTASGGTILFNTGVSYLQWRIPRQTSLNDVELTYGSAAAATIVNTTIHSTYPTDGADDDKLCLSGGGAAVGAGVYHSTSRGATICLTGNEETNTGSLWITSGDKGSQSDIYIRPGVNSADLYIGYGTGTTNWTFDSDTGDVIQTAASGGNLVFQRDGYGVIDSTEPTAAAGADLAGATAIAANVTLVTGADGAKGVKFGTAPIGGQRFVIWNTANADLKIYPGEAGDQINAAGAGNAITVAAYTGCYCHASSASQLWCGEMAAP